MKKDESFITHAQEATLSGGEYVTHIINIHYFKSTGHFTCDTLVYDSRSIADYDILRPIIGLCDGGTFSKEKSHDIRIKLQDLGFTSN
jgi:hypothetical protein